MELAWDLRISGPPGTATAVIPMDLTEQVELWDRRDSVEQLSVETVEVVILEVGALNRAETARLRLRFRAAGAPDDGSANLPLLELDALRLIAGERVAAESATGLADAIHAALAGDGRFGLVTLLDAERPVDVRLQLFISGFVMVSGGVE